MRADDGREQLGICQKAVMPVRRDKLPVSRANAAGARSFGQGKYIIRRKEPVRRDANEQKSRAYLAQGIIFRLKPTRQIESVHRLRDRDIRVGIEAFGETQSLIIQITGDVEATLP